MERKESFWHKHKDFVWDKTFPQGSMYKFASRRWDEFYNNSAIEFEGKKTTYKQLSQQIDSLAKVLIAHGIKKGDCISIVSINIPQVIVMIYAANRIGAVVNMIHPLLSPVEMKAFIQNTNSVAVLILDQIYPKLEKIEWDNRFNPTIILTRIADALPAFIKPIFLMKAKINIALNPKHKTIYWNDYVKNTNTENVRLPEDNGKADDLAMIMYSGGTSGTPKGVMLSNLNLNCYALTAYETLKAVDPVGKKSLAILPMFHGFGFGSSVHVNLLLGVQIFLVPKFEFKKSVELVFKKKINFITAVPAFYEAMMRNPLIDNTDLSFLESCHCGGDKMPKKLYARFSSLLEKGNSQAVLCEGYGQTECVAGCIVNPYFALNHKSVGMALPDVETKIVKPGTHEEVPNGEDGELCVCSPLVMMGYYKNEEETKKALQVHADGKTWLHTGDVLCKDDEGYFYFKQRISRMVISAGYNIYVTQMEKIISECDEVAECCVVGIEDKILGQKIRAYVVPANPDIDKQTLKKVVMEKCKNNMAEYSQPHEIRVINKLPMTHIGKVDYKKLESEK